MTKTFETTRKVQKLLGLFLRFGALLLLLYALIGCSADQHIVVSGGRTIEPGVIGPADAQGLTSVASAKEGTAGPDVANVTVGATGEPGTVVANPAGEQDAAGEPAAKGAARQTGEAPTPAVSDRWTCYRDFKFDSNQTNLRVSDANTVFEIAIYIKANPTLKVGFDGSMEPLNQDLSDQRVATVRDALIEAGVPGSRIQAGVFTDGKSAHDGRVAVLVRTVD